MSDKKKEGFPTWNTCKIAPCICRLLAKTGDLLATDPELMKRTGWSRARLVGVYKRARWDGVTVGDMDRFLWACGLTPDKQRRYLWLLKRAMESKDGIKSMRHLRTCNQAWRASTVEALVKMVEKVLENEYGDTE